LGSLVVTLVLCYKFGWGWDKFVEEANTGRGMKVKNWMKPIFKYLVPVVIIFIYVYGLFTYKWR
jgi:NSS family neurotransmitter:Na+ symporter